MAILVTNKTLYSHLFITRIDLLKVCFNDKYHINYNYFYFLDFNVLILIILK